MTVTNAYYDENGKVLPAIDDDEREFFGFNFRARTRLFRQYTRHAAKTVSVVKLSIKDLIDAPSEVKAHLLPGNR